MLASGIRRRGCFRDEARRHGDPSDLADDGGRRRCAGPSRTRTWRTRCSGWSAYVVVIDNNLVRSGVQAIGMAFAITCGCDGFETGTMYIYASSRRVQTVWGDSRREEGRKAEMKQPHKRSQETRAPALFTHEARHAGLGHHRMPDAVEVLGGMSKGRCRRRCQCTPRTRGMYYRLCCM
jgi:hypothetical protein